MNILLSIFIYKDIAIDELKESTKSKNLFIVSQNFVVKVTALYANCIDFFLLTLIKDGMQHYFK